MTLLLLLMNTEYLISKLAPVLFISGDCFIQSSSLAEFAGASREKLVQGNLFLAACQL